MERVVVVARESGDFPVVDGCLIDRIEGLGDSLGSSRRLYLGVQPAERRPLGLVSIPGASVKMDLPQDFRAVRFLSSLRL